MAIFFLLLIPAIEIYVIFQVADVIGGWETFWLLMVISFVGLSIIRNLGISSLAAYQRQVQRGEQPENMLFRNLCLFVGGVLLLIPGFISDFFGLLLIFPLTRKLFVNQVSQFFKSKVQSGTNGVFYYSYTSTNHTPRSPNMRDVNDIKDVTPLSSQESLLQKPQENNERNI